MTTSTVPVARFAAHAPVRAAGAAASPAPRTAVEPSAPSTPDQPPAKDNRASYVGWGLAYLVGWGAFAVSGGDDPVLDLPSALPAVLLVVGLLSAFVVTAVGIARHAKQVTGPAAVAGQLLGAAWAIGFTALFLLITATAGDLGVHRVETLLWPAGSGLVVGMMYLMGGVVERDKLQYALGTWLALVTTAAVFLGTPGMYAVLALAGGGAYLLAAHLEPRRLAAARHTATRAGVAG